MQEKVLDGSALEKVRRKKRRRRLRRMALFCLALAAVLFWLTGLGGIYAGRIADLFDTVMLRVRPGPGFPVDAAVDVGTEMETMREALVLMDDREATVYAASGRLLRSVQHSYANPCLAAGKNRFCIYNRGGKELRMEGRTRSYGSLSVQGNIWFAMMSEKDTLAVATQHESYQGVVTVYTGNMEKLFSWYSASAYPVTAAFAPDGRQLAVCGVSAQGGVYEMSLYTVSAKGEQAAVSRSGSLALQMAWLAGDRLLVAYEDALVMYRASTLEQLYSYPMGQPLLCCDLTAKGGPVLVNGNIGADTDVTLTVLDKELLLQRTAQVPAASLPRNGSRMRWQCLQQEDKIWLLGSRQVLGFSRQEGGDALWQVSHQPVRLAGGQALYLLTAGELTKYTPTRDQ